MCDFSGRLIAWLDGELAADEAVEVGRHLRVCADCRNELRVYERLSGALDAYCEAAMMASGPCRVHFGKPAALGVGITAVAAAVVVVLLAWPRPHDTHPSARPAPAAAVRTVEEAHVAPARVVPARVSPSRAPLPRCKTRKRAGRLLSPRYRSRFPRMPCFPRERFRKGLASWRKCGSRRTVCRGNSLAGPDAWV